MVLDSSAQTSDQTVKGFVFILTFKNIDSTICDFFLPEAIKMQKNY